MEGCKHTSEYLTLNVVRRLDSDHVAAFLGPKRGLGRVRGWELVLSPHYDICVE